MTLRNGNVFSAQNPNWKWPFPLRKGLTTHLQLEKTGGSPDKTAERREGKCCRAYSTLINKKCSLLARNGVYLSQVSEETSQ